MPCAAIGGAAVTAPPRGGSGGGPTGPGCASGGGAGVASRGMGPTRAGVRPCESSFGPYVASALDAETPACPAVSSRSTKSPM